MLEATTRRWIFLCLRIPSSRTAVPTVVYAGILGDLVHALTDADDRNEVVDGINALECAVHGGRIADVTDLQFNIRIKISRPLSGRDHAPEGIGCQVP